MIHIPVYYNNETTITLTNAEVVFGVDQYDISAAYFDRIDSVHERKCIISGVRYSAFDVGSARYISPMEPEEIVRRVREDKVLFYSLN